MKLDEIGVEPHRTVEFALSDGKRISRRVGDAYFEMNGEGAAAPVIYGEEGDSALLGGYNPGSDGIGTEPV